MSSPRKHKDRRIGFSQDNHGRPRTRARAGTWSPSVRREARWLYLEALRQEAPGVLRELQGVSLEDESALNSWAKRWGLLSSDPADPWGIEHGRAVLRFWKRFPKAQRTYWVDRDDIRGVQCDDDAPLESRPLKHADHFRWLARYQTDRADSLQWVARVTIGVTPQGLQDNIRALAGHLLLRLRPLPKGRPRKKKFPNA